MSDLNPSLYEILLQNFDGEMDLHQISERDQHLLSVLDNVQRILNSRAGGIAHLPDYGLPDLSLILNDVTGAAQGLVDAMTETLLKYEPRLGVLNIELTPQSCPGHLEYRFDVQLRDGDNVVFGTTFGAEGRVLVRHLKRQHWLPTP